MPGALPYKSDKSIPWNYGGEIYHGIKQDGLTAEEMSSKEKDSDISNIVGTSKITRSGRIFSPEISPPKEVFGPVVVPKVTSVPIIIFQVLLLTKTTQPLLLSLPTLLLLKFEEKVFKKSLSR